MKVISRSTALAMPYAHERPKFPIERTPKSASEAKPSAAVAPAATITGPIDTVEAITAARLSRVRSTSSP